MVNESTLTARDNAESSLIVRFLFHSDKEPFLSDPSLNGRVFLDMMEFIKINIEAETSLLKKAKDRYGKMSKEYKKRLEHLKDLKKWI